MLYIYIYLYLFLLGKILTYSLYTISQISIDRKEHRITELKDEVKRELLAAAVEPSQQQLNIIDAIQRLGVAYHFEKEIEEIDLTTHT